MYHDFKEDGPAISISRFIVLLCIFLLLPGLLISRIFVLQIVNGEKYLEEFQLQIKKERTIPSTRGNIFDCNGKVLAYNELAYSIKIEDVFESGKKKNAKLNEVIYKLIKMIEKNGDKIISDFQIYIDENGEYAYSVSDSALLRFKADVYGEKYVTDLSYEQKTATAKDMIEYLAGRKQFGIGDYEDPADSSTFVVGKGYSKSEVLKMVTIRYAMRLTGYQKYIGTTVATDVSDKTVAVIMENMDELEGVSVEEDTARRYVDSVYFSNIIGYTGKISQEELEELNAKEMESIIVDEDAKLRYDMNDVVGKTGIEEYMENELQGQKGYETVFVDNLGKVIEVSDIEEPTAGNDVYLSIDHDLQAAIYHILEQRLAGILTDKIINAKEYNSTSNDIKIPIYDVYYALINNGVIDLSHMSSENARETEKSVWETFLAYKAKTLERIRTELEDTKTPYEKLSKEYQVYESYIIKSLEDKGIIDTSLYDTSEATYIAWKKEETISMAEFLEYCIANNFIVVSKLDIHSAYADSAEIFSTIEDYICQMLDNSNEFNKKIFKYMILSDTITGKQLCLVVCEQGKVELNVEDVEKLYQGNITAFHFLVNRISSLEITPAQLALDPYSASIVVTDVNTGQVKALVSYPGYDNNRMANSADAKYYASLQADLSRPMLNYATQHKSAPGSTFKMVVSAAGLEEGYVNTDSKITCLGLFDKLNSNSRCWIYPSAHGSLNVSDAIKNSCNYFFYELGYRMSMNGDTYDAKKGLDTLYKYADLFGLSEKSGVEIDESEPQVSDELPILSAIGQGTNNFTTVGLARYVTTVANSGTCYDLTLLDHLTDYNGNMLKKYQANIRNTVPLSNSTWNAIHSGMRKVVEAKAYYTDIGVNVAGKTGTAQEDRSRANHALFVAYAPYEKPEIAISTRIAYGYTSDYAAQATKDVISYYYHLENTDEIITGTAEAPDAGGITNEW